jgi:hypothetical protein
MAVSAVRPAVTPLGILEYPEAPRPLTKRFGKQDSNVRSLDNSAPQRYHPNGTKNAPLASPPRRGRKHVSEIFMARGICNVPV